MNYKLLSVALAFLYIGMVGGCSQPAPDLRYQIEVDKPLQTMEHFGASDAWSMHILGLCEPIRALACQYIHLYDYLF